MDPLAPGQIPDGRKQTIAGLIALALGVLLVFGAAADDSRNGGEGVAAAGLVSLAGALLFWGVMQRYLSVLERKIDRVLGPSFSFVPADATAPRTPVDWRVPTARPSAAEPSPEESERVRAKVARMEAQNRAIGRLLMIAAAIGVVVLIFAYTTGRLTPGPAAAVAPGAGAR